MPFKYVSQPKTLNEFILEALYAGIVGGSAIALFFLVADLMDGRPLYTPSLIGSMLFLGVGIEDVKVRFDAIAYFSLLHIVIFTALGAITSFIVHAVEIHARHPALLLLGLFGVIEVSFFIIAPLAMPGLIHELTIARVAIGNLAAATALTAFFVITHHSKTRGKFRHRRGDVIFDSFFSGAVGGTTVAMFFFVVDIVDGHPFFTPALIGHVLILGESAMDIVNPVMSNSVILMIPIHFAWSIMVLRGLKRPQRSLNLHDILFFGFKNRIDLGNHLIGEFLRLL